MSVPARAATRRAAAGSICCPASVTACLHQRFGLPGHLPQIEPLGVLAPLQAPALDDRRVLLDGLVETPHPIDVGGDEHERRQRLRARARTLRAHRRLRPRLAVVRLVLVFTFAAPFGLERSSRREARRRRADRPSSAASAPPRRSPPATPAFSPAYMRSRLNARSSSSTTRREIGREPRHLRLVVADDQVDGIELALRDLLADRLGVDAGINQRRASRRVVPCSALNASSSASRTPRGSR